MRIDPAIAGLRRDPAPQRVAQAALEAVRDRWLGDPAVAPLIADLEAYGADAPLAARPHLARALSSPREARGLVGALVTPMLAALGDQPLGHVPFRHQFAPGLMVLQLATAGRAALSLVCYQEQRGDDARAQTVCFAGGDRHELCLAGSADARFFEVLREEPARVDIDCEPRRLAAGDRLSFGGPRHTKIVDRPHGRLAILRLSRSDANPHTAREYRIADGQLVHRASGDRRESRDEMAAAVLGAMGRADAVPVLATLAQSRASDHLRWQALRQALALDTAAGFAALTALAASPDDPLAAHAGALRASLVEGHPALAVWSGPCLAS